MFKSLTNRYVSHRRMTKFWLIMRLTSVILIAAFMQVSAKTMAQKITLDFKNKPLIEVLKEIRSQSGYDFLYSGDVLNAAKPISINVKQVNLENVLALCFKGQPITYRISNKSVLLKLDNEIEGNPRPKNTEVAAANDVGDAFGIVIDEKGNPLVGASVIVKNGKSSTVTNNRGEFILRNVHKNAIVQVSYMGYVTQDVPVGNYLLEVRLKESKSSLDEVQVMAYGKTSKRYSTGNITTVTGEELQRQPVMNPLMALVGKVPGMNIAPNSGHASGSVKVEIRGRGTVSKDFPSDPLYVVDGVPLTYLDIGGIGNYEFGSTGVIQDGSITAGWGQSPLFNMNTADIASIEVLKDADATAIYGSRGANGVILITTKKGEAGPTKITANVSQGITKATRYWDLLHTQDYVNMRKEALKNDGKPVNMLTAPDLVGWDTTRYTNWQRELWGGTGKVTNVKLNIAGGDANTQFSVSPNYEHSTDIMTVSGATQRMGVAISINNYAFNKRLKTNLQTMYTYTKVNMNNTISTSTLSPNAPSIFNSYGQLNYGEWNDVGLPDSFPFGSMRDLSYSKTSLMMANLNVGYELITGLHFNTAFGFNLSSNSAGGEMPIASQNPIYTNFGGVTRGNSDNQNWNIEPQLNYKRTIGPGTLSAFMGATLQGSIASGLNIRAFGYDDDNLLGSLAFAPIKLVTDTYGQYKYAAVSGRLNYQTNKYVVNISGRRDGSSRFGPGKRYGNFGALGLVWIASEESWMQEILPTFVDFVKFKGSYGLTGSDGVGDYRYFSQWTSQLGAVNVFPYGGTTALIPMFAVNPDYRWQVNRKLDLTAEFGLWSDRLTFLVNWYRNRVGNQLTNYPTPLYTGFGDVTANWSATIQNSGLEFSLTAKLISQNNFNWSMSINGGSNKNILLKYKDLATSPYASELAIGRSVNDKYFLHYLGVDPMTGNYAFEDRNGDGAINVNPSNNPGSGLDDRYVVLNLDPKFMGSMSHNLTYKSLSLNFTFFYKNQLGVNPFYAGPPAGDMYNIPQEVYNNRWQKPGDVSKYAKLTTQTGGVNGYVTGSDVYYTDASFLRLQNVSLFYTLPSKIMKGKSLSVSFNAQNLFVISKFKGVDPDVQNYSSLPTPKIMMAGLNLTF